MPPLRRPAVLILLAVSLPAAEAQAGARWARPVDGELVRPFMPGRYSAGAHRGVDLAAAPGTVVGAACRGRVAFAGPTPSGATVTVACGRWRATHLPLRPAVGRGERVAAGQAVGRLLAGHGGLHLGVRARADRLGYVDPLRFLPPPAPWIGPPGTVASRRLTPPRPDRVHAPPPAGLPWTVPAGGLVLAAAGAAGVRLRVRRRKRREGPRQAPLVSYP